MTAAHEDKTQQYVIDEVDMARYIKFFKKKKKKKINKKI